MGKELPSVDLDSDGYIRGMGRLSRVGVRLTRWETLRVRFWLWLRQPARAQRIILKAIGVDG